MPRSKYSLLQIDSLVISSKLRILILLKESSFWNNLEMQHFMLKFASEHLLVLLRVGSVKPNGFFEFLAGLLLHFSMHFFELILNDFVLNLDSEDLFVFDRTGVAKILRSKRTHLPSGVRAEH